MNKKMRRFFVLKNFRDFFLPDAFASESDKSAESDIVSEAESIINDYFKKMGYADKKKSRGSLGVALLYIGIAAVVAAVIFLAVRLA